MKKADLNFSSDNYMMRSRKLFRVNLKFGVKPIFAVLLALFFFVLIYPFYALEFLFQVKTPSNTSTSSIFLLHHRIHYGLSKAHPPSFDVHSLNELSFITLMVIKDRSFMGALVFFGLLTFITKP
jgi:hypothetical protein